MKTFIILVLLTIQWNIIVSLELRTESWNRNKVILFDRGAWDLEDKKILFATYDDKCQFNHFNLKDGTTEKKSCYLDTTFEDIRSASLRELSHYRVAVSWLEKQDGIVKNGKFSIIDMRSCLKFTLSLPIDLPIGDPTLVFEIFDGESKFNVLISSKSLCEHSDRCILKYNFYGEREKNYNHQGEIHDPVPFNINLTDVKINSYSHSYYAGYHVEGRDPVTGEFKVFNLVNGNINNQVTIDPNNILMLSLNEMGSTIVCTANYKSEKKFHMKANSTSQNSLDTNENYTWKNETKIRCSRFGAESFNTCGTKVYDSIVKPIVIGTSDHNEVNVLIESVECFKEKCLDIKVLSLNIYDCDGIRDYEFKLNHADEKEMLFFEIGKEDVKTISYGTFRTNEKGTYFSYVKDVKLKRVFSIL